MVKDHSVRNSSCELNHFAGQIFSATDKQLQKRVAIKRERQNVEGTSSLSQEFNVLRLLAQKGASQVPKVFDMIHQDEGEKAYTMELLGKLNCFLSIKYSK